LPGNFSTGISRKVLVAVKSPNRSTVTAIIIVLRESVLGAVLQGSRAAVSLRIPLDARRSDVEKISWVQSR